MSTPKILIVEDEQIVALDLSSTLSNLGFQIAGITGTGAQALQIAEEVHPDLALMDISIKGTKDGIDAAEELRRKFQIPVVFLTAFSDDAIVARARESGALGYLTKPFRTNELNATILIALRRHQVARELVQQRTWLTSLLAGINDGVIATDKEGRVTFLNPQAEHLTGWASADALGKMIEEVCPLFTQERVKLTESRMREVLRSGLTNRRERFLLRAGSRDEVPVEELASALLEGGAVLGAVMLLHDIRERLSIEQAHNLQSVGVLAGGVAHDFNNLLTTMIGNASLAMDARPPLDPTRPLLNEVLKAGMKAAELTQQLLAYAGKARFVKTEIDISQSVREMLDLVKATVPPAIKLDLRLADKIEPIHADSVQIQQILMNLVINAVEALSNRAGSVGISTGVFGPGELPAPHGKAVFLRVQDTGPGLDPATRSKIFEPFFTTKFLGRGLGLAAVHGIVRAHGGKIDVESAPETGTRFTVVFPASSGRSKKVRLRKSKADLSGRGTILVVDDTEHVGRFTKQALQSFGYSVLLADGGHAAVELVEQHDEIQMVLLDLSMPDLSGEETGQRIREMRPDLPICGMSGYNETVADQRFSGKFITAGFLQKPFSPERLAQTVKTVLNNSKGVDLRT